MNNIKNIFDKIIVDGTEIDLQTLEDNGGKLNVNKQKDVTVEYYLKDNTIIPSNLFNELNQLKKVYFTEEVDNINEKSFYNDINLSYINTLKYISYIGPQAFSYTNLTYVDGATKPTTVANNAWSYISTLTTEFKNQLLGKYSYLDFGVIDSPYDPWDIYNPDDNNPGTDPVNPDPGTDPVNPNPEDDPVNPDPGTDPVNPNPEDDPESEEISKIISFDNSPSDNGFTVSGKYGDGKITYDNTYYQKGLKLASTGSITFTSNDNYNMTIILSLSKNGRDVKINNQLSEVGGTESSTEENYYQMDPIQINENTEYTISKGSAESVLMLIILTKI